jgi:histidine kinase
MRAKWFHFKDSIVFKLTVAMGVLFLVGLLVQTFFITRYQEQKSIDNMTQSVRLLGNTIRLGTHYAMMLNAREDINQIIQKIGQQDEIVSLRIYSKTGEVKYTKDPNEENLIIGTDAPACKHCHVSDPPLVETPLSARTRFFRSDQGKRWLGITSPIYNEPGCATDSCHFHKSETQVLGILDVVVSLQATDRALQQTKWLSFMTALVMFVITATIIYKSITQLVIPPIRKLIVSTRNISKGEYRSAIEVSPKSEIGQLAIAINRMGGDIEKKQKALNQQRDEYERLFETVPCFVTVQDRNFKLKAFNQKFANQFGPQVGDFCFQAYKGRDQKCTDCPVEKTFEDGLPHFSEESGVAKDGHHTHWIVTTSPIKNNDGDIVAAMEMSLDVTPLKQLEERLQLSEKKYRAIFDNIPNPVFVLDKSDFTIMACNSSVKDLYGYHPSVIVGQNFLNLFDSTEKTVWESQIRQHNVLDQVRHKNSAGQTLFVSIRLSPAPQPEGDMLLAVISDITKRVEAEIQLVQAGKMATLGEMATGVAHELNQPLSVIKTASGFFMRKVNRREEIDQKILLTMAQEIDNHVDRATKIINHMREFGRKSTGSTELVSLNDVVQRALDFFSQQLKLRQIEIQKQFQPDLPNVRAEASRLEQVFINLLINARDAIEEREQASEDGAVEKRIILRTYSTAQQVVADVCDTGIGIDAVQAERIFEPFYTTKKVGKGTGLGLSITYGIIQGYGGTIRVIPQVAPGMCIRIKLPIPEEVA